MRKEQELSEVCHLMAVLFYDPQEFLSGEDAVVWSEYQEVVAAADPALGELYSSLQWAATSVDLTALRVDYAVLFVGPGELRACPYGSVHLEKGHQLYGETTRAVAELYARAGLQIGGDSVMIHDHIAVELEFLHYLLHHMAMVDSPPSANLFSPFLQRFFLPFAKRLAGKISLCAQTDFYRLLGEMLQRLTVILAANVPSAAVEAVVKR